MEIHIRLPPDFPVPAERIRMLRETVEIVTAMWSESDVTYEGRHYSLDGAQCDPKPVQSPRPQVLIGGGGEQLTLRVVARLAQPPGAIYRPLGAARRPPGLARGLKGGRSPRCRKGWGAATPSAWFSGAAPPVDSRGLAGSAPG